MSGIEPIHPTELATLVEQLLSVHTDDRIASVDRVEGEYAVEVQRHDGSFLVIEVTTEGDRS